MPSTPVRARDLRTNIHELGFEKGVVATIEQFLEEFAAHRAAMREVVALIDRCIQEVEKFNLIGGKMQTVVDQLRRDLTKGDEIDDAG